jgi:hypothetical protein
MRAQGTKPNSSSAGQNISREVEKIGGGAQWSWARYLVGVGSQTCFTKAAQLSVFALDFLREELASNTRVNDL